MLSESPDNRNSSEVKMASRHKGNSRASLLAGVGTVLVTMTSSQTRTTWLQSVAPSINIKLHFIAQQNYQKCCLLAENQFH